MAYKPVHAHASCVFDIAGCGKIGEINKIYLYLSSVVLSVSVFVLYLSYCLVTATLERPTIHC